MNNYTTSLKALLITVVCLFLSGCDVVFISPLVVPKDAVVDKRLIGRWRISNAALHEKGYVTIKQSGRKLIVASVTPKKLKDKLMKEFYTVSCNEKNFIVAAYTGRVKKSEHKGYMAIMYKLENDSLKVLLPDPAMFKAAITEGKLHGTAGEPFDSTIIVDPANEALKFLCSADDKFFGPLGELERAD
jgi:hypothetical protein